MATITTPVKGFTGVVVGVTFTDGRGESEDPAVLQYFRRHGYKVKEAALTTPEQPEQSQGQVEPPAGNASTEAWAAYASAQGRTEEELKGLGRDEIKALLTPAGDQNPSA